MRRSSARLDRALVPHAGHDELNQLQGVEPSQLLRGLTAQFVRDEDVDQVAIRKCPQLSTQPFFAVAVSGRRIEHGSHFRDTWHERCERPMERTFQIHRTQTRCPVQGVDSVRLSRLSSRFESFPAIERHELDPSVPVAVVRLGAAGAGNVGDTIGI